MSRKNPFANLDLSTISGGATPPRPAYGMTGAAKTVVRSIEEMAENTKRLLDGETIVELDPGLLDGSFVADRLSDQNDEYEELKHAIRESGQATPILVRPSPDDANRYMVVFGHRRVRAARDLGIKVKAIVKKLDDTASAIAQGQENSARSNLSFIERAFFARNLLSNGMAKDVVKSAIAIDDAMLSKMLSVIEAVPSAMLDMVGASKKIGRDKWLSLRQIILNPAYLQAGLEHIATDEFKAQPEDERFDALHDYLKRYSTRSKARAPRTATSTTNWRSKDNAVSMTMSKKLKKVSIELSSSKAGSFSDWLSTRLDRLYDEFEQSKNENTGE